MPAKILTSLVAAAAMVASLAVATPADALNQRERNIVGGIALGVLGTLAIQNATKKKYKSQPRYHAPQRACYNPVRVWRQGRIVTVCR
jgi:uncharacterized membrane protein YebE (DUF533 family)